MLSKAKVLNPHPQERKKNTYTNQSLFFTSSEKCPLARG